MKSLFGDANSEDGTSENPFHELDQTSQDNEIVIILQTLLDNLVKIKGMDDSLIVKVWSLFEGSALIPYLTNKMLSCICGEINRYEIHFKKCQKTLLKEMFGFHSTLMTI